MDADDVIEQLILSPIVDLAAASANLPFDAVVIGGGPTGLTSARTLAESGHRVAVLEAGPLALLTHAESTDLRFVGGSIRALRHALGYSPMLGDGSEFGRLIGCVGGRGMFWTGGSPRYLPTDFADWPIDYGELEPFYQWAEGDLLVSTDWGRTALADHVGRMLRQAGIDAEPEPLAIDSRASVNGWLSGTVGNPVTQLLRSGLIATEGERRLSVAANAFAIRINRAKDRRHMEVAVRDRANGGNHLVAARSVVLAAGGFESVRLAITSELPDESGTMGRGLRDHWFTRGYFPLSPHVYDQERPEAAALLVRPRDTQPFQMEIHLPGRLFLQAHAGAEWRPNRTEAYSVMARAFAPTRCHATSQLEVTDRESPGGYTVHMEATDADRELRDAMAAGLLGVRDALGADEAEIDEYPLGSSYHEAGGLRMAVDAAGGVVDPYGRFFGSPRIVVVDASTWPSIGCANPHVTLLAIARRQASALARDLLGKGKE